MKVLQVNNVYGEKSTGKLTRQVHEGLLERGVQSVAIYGRGREYKSEGVVRLCPDWYGKLNSLLSRFTAMPYGGCLLSTLRLQRIIRREQPDIVHLQCINGNFVNIYRLVAWLKKNRIKTVVSLHAEFMYTANCAHAFDCRQWHKGCQKCPDHRKAVKSLLFDRTARSYRAMKAAFSGFGKDCVICPVSDWTGNRGKQSDILSGLPFVTVFNGLDNGVFCRDAHDSAEENVVLHVTARFDTSPGHPKGGDWLPELARRMPQVTFLVAGPAEPIPDCPNNIKLLGMVRDQNELARLYRRASATLLLSRRETFSMPCAESLCCGTPVVGFEAGGPETIALPEYSEFVSYGDVNGLQACLQRCLQRNYDRDAMAAAAGKAYSSEAMVDAFMNVYRSLL